MGDDTYQKETYKFMDVPQFRVYATVRFISMTRGGLKLTFSPPYLTVLFNHVVSPIPSGILSQAFIESIKPYRGVVPIQFSYTTLV